MLSFDHSTHIRLMKQSSELAKKYRIDCGLEKPVVIVAEKPVKPVKKVKEVKETVIKKEDKKIENKEERVGIPEYNREGLKELLKKADIKFFNGAKTKKLLEICIKNKLV